MPVPGRVEMSPRAHGQRLYDPYAAEPAEDCGMAAPSAA